MDYTNDKINKFITQLEKDNGINTKKIKSFRNLLNNFISSEKEEQIEKQKKEEQDEAKKKSFIETKKFLSNEIKIVTMKSEKYGMEDVLNNPSLNIGKTQDPEKIIVIMGLGYYNIYQYNIMRYNHDNIYKFKYK